MSLCYSVRGMKGVSMSPGMSQFVFILVFVILPLAVGLYVGGAIGATRGRRTAGQLLGLFLGPIGWIITLLLPREGRRCPFCREVVADDATACPHCQREIPSPRGAPSSRTYASPTAQKMEKVIVSCPSCQARFKVQKSKVGPCFRCLKCGVRFKPAPEPLPPPSAAQQDDKTVVVSCPDCGSRYRVHRIRVGLGFQCQKCGAHFNAMPEA